MLQRFKRKDRFLFKEYTEGKIRYDITSQNDTKLLGSVFGSVILSNFKHDNKIQGIYTFGRIGMGKTVFSTAIIKSFENTEDLLIDVKHGVRYRFYDTFPKCHHIDYYDVRCPDFEYKDKIELKENELIIAEWSERIQRNPIDFLEEDRIEVELYHCFDKKSICNEHFTDYLNFSTITSEGSMRFASFIGYGKGIAVVEELKAKEEVKHLIVDQNEL